jgi:hypothetical protein
MKCEIHSKALSNFTPNPSHAFYLRLCTNCARMRLLHRDCAQWSRQNASGDRCHFVGSTVKLFQSLALHLQFHLRILLEDLRFALAEHLGCPFIGCASGTQPCGISVTCSPFLVQSKADFKDRSKRHFSVDSALPISRTSSWRFTDL